MSKAASTMGFHFRKTDYDRERTALRISRWRPQRMGYC